MSRGACGRAWLFVATLALSCATATTTRPALRICLEAENAPFSSASVAHRGIDHEVAARVARSLARPLEVHWLAGGQEEELLLSSRANRALSSSRCDLIAGYPLTRDGLRVTPPAAAALPSSGGDPAPSRGAGLLASRAYLALPLTVVSFADGPTVSELEDLVGLRVAVERASLASAIATVYAGGELRPRLVRVSFDGDAVFRALEDDAADAAFVELHRFEIYRARRSETTLRETGYRHGLAVHVGFVGIDPTLVMAVDRVLHDLASDGEIAEIVGSRGLSYSAPGGLTILPRLTPRLLAQPDSGR